MTTSAIIIADSISPQGKRLTTFQLRYPRFVHAEFMTHRVFSRNASSSRAIPTKRMIQDVIDDPVEPSFWGKNQAGMQAREELTDISLEWAKNTWKCARENAIFTAKELSNIGAHKQIVNRVLEPYSHINVVATATNLANFFTLRSHPDAQPEMQVLSDAMANAMLASKPKFLTPGEWHLPYITDEDWRPAVRERQKNRITRDMPSEDEIITILRKVSVARCARVSYLTHDGRKTSVEEDVALHDKLVVAVPLHASPAEHQATPDTHQHLYSPVISPCNTISYKGEHYWNNLQEHGNFDGWRQYRKMLPNENVPG